MVRGETKKMTVLVKDKATGDPIDCSAAIGVGIGLYQQGGKILQKWSLNALTGFDTVDMTDADTGRLVVYIKAENLLAGIRQKTLRVQANIIFSTPGYPDGKEISIDTNIVVEELEPSIFEGINFTP